MRRSACTSTRLRSLAAGLALVITCAGSALAQRDLRSGSGPNLDTQQDRILKEVRLDQQLNAQVPLDLPFKEEDSKGVGRDVTLREYFDKPVMLMLIQFRCTMLCTAQMETLTESLKELKFTAGKEFNLLIVSIDSREKPDLGAEMKDSMLKRIERPQAAAGLHFLTGTDASINALAQSLGFHFKYDKRTDQFAHPDGVIIVTPAGKVAKYFFSLNYAPRDMRYGLIEAARNRIGTVIDAIALLCFHYNPATGKYGLAVVNLVRMGGVATVLMLAIGVLVMKRRDRAAQPARATLKVEG